MKGVKQLFSDSIIYGGANALYSAVPILLLPFLTVHLPKEEYGIYANFTMAFALLGAIISYSVPSAVSVYYYDKRYNFQKVLGSGISISIAVSVLLLVLSILLNSSFSVAFEVPSFLISYALLYSFLDLFYQTALNWWRMEEKPLMYLWFRLGRMVIELGLTFFFVISIYPSWEGRAFANVGAVIILLVPIVSFLKKRGILNLKIDRDSIQELTRFNGGNLVHILGSVLINYLDIFLITFFLDFSFAGEYSVAYQIGMGVSLVANSFNQAYVPWLFKSLNSKAIERNNLLILISLISIGFVLVGVILFVLSPYIYEFFIGENYVYESGVVFWIIAGFTINGVYKLGVNFLFYHKRMGVISLLTFIAASLNLVLNLWLIPLLGIEGAALATFISFAIQAILVMFFIRRSFKTIWS